jgi:DNA polymerase-1
VTGDLDELQLVSPQVKVMTTVKGVTETVVYDEEAVRARYGLSPDRLRDFKALKGDPSDNIPGVSGIGEKTAARLIQEFGSLENLFQNLDKVKEPRVRAALEAEREKAELSARLATIITDVPLDIDLEKCRFGKPDYLRLREIFRRLEFRSLLRKLPAEAPQQTLFERAVPETSQAVAVSIVSGRKKLDALLRQVRRAGRMSFRINGTSGRGVDAEPGGITVSAADSPHYVSFEDGLTLVDFREVLESPDIEKYGHNLKFEYEVAGRLGIELRGKAFDTLLAGYLLNPTRGTHSLDEVALDYLQIELPSQDRKTGQVSGPNGESTPEQLFAAQVDAIRMLVPILGAKLAEDELTPLMEEIEMPLVPILAEMELTGVRVDTDWLEQLSDILGERILELEQSIYQLAGTEFNIGSPRQLQTILFDKLGLAAARKTKTGYSTDAETLAGLAAEHEIVAKILEYRELTKLKSTYADSLPKLMNPRTGRIHTSLNQAVTATGRLSSSDPNLQNIPIKTEIGRQIRRAFIATPGNVLVSADYSQIELRILAHVSKDPELIRAFRADEDIHTRTATRLFEVTPDQVTPEMRRQAKTVNFAVIYGMSDYGLSRSLGIPTQVAGQYIQEYFQEYPGVKMYAAETLARGRSLGYVESLFGRRRYLPELHSPNRQYREFAERAAINMPIQGTAADIVKLAMIQVHSRLLDRGLRAKLILQVHDELVFEVAEAQVSETVPLIRKSMEEAFTLDVPLKVEVKVGKDWCTASPVIEEVESVEV